MLTLCVSHSSWFKGCLLTVDVCYDFAHKLALLTRAPPLYWDLYEWFIKTLFKITEKCLCWHYVFRRARGSRSADGRPVLWFCSPARTASAPPPSWHFYELFIKTRIKITENCLCWHYVFRTVRGSRSAGGRPVLWLYSQARTANAQPVLTCFMKLFIKTRIKITEKCLCWH